jgi:5-formyltetrahydrofolate cyclo-ligase
LAELGAPEVLAREPRLIAGYRALGGEIDPEPLLMRLVAAGLPLCLPVAAERSEEGLWFRLWRPQEPLVRGPFGAQEPAAAAPLVVPDLVLTPLLAFDRRGGRLGRGGGYYDRTLERLGAAGVWAVGLAFAEQEVEDVPLEPHDIRLDGVLTEQGAVALTEERS